MSRLASPKRAHLNYTVMTAILGLSGMAVMSSLYVTIPLTSLFEGVFNVTSAQAAATGSIFSLVFAIGCLIFGALSDKYGRKKMMVIGLFVLIFITLLLGLVDHFTWLIVLRGFQGAAAATFSPVVMTYAVEVFPAEKRMTAIGFISTGFLASGIAGQVVASLISEQFGWHFVFYFFTVVYVMICLLMMRLPAEGKAHGTSGGIKATFQSMKIVFMQKRLLLAYAIAFVLLMSFISMYTALGNYLGSSAFGLSRQQILYVRMIGVLGMVVAPFAGKLGNRFGIRTLLIGGLCLSTISLILLGAVTYLPLLVGISVLFVAGIAINVPTLITLVGQLGGKVRGIAVSVYIFIMFAGTSIGPILPILFTNLSTYRWTFVYLAFILGIGILAACLIRNGPTDSNN